MNKNYIIAIVVVVLLVGAVIIFGSSKKAQAPIQEIPKTGACTMDAKMCPDGSYVGRIAPSCDFAACPGVKDTTTAAVKEFTVSGSNYFFTPSLLTVKKGDRVRIIFKNENGFHDFKIDELSVATQKIQGGAQEIIEFTADKVGSFQYYCSVGAHRANGMWGTLKVE